MKVKLWLVLAVLLSTSVNAQLFQIINRSSTVPAEAAAANRAFDSLETAINADLPTASPLDFAGSLGNAGVIVGTSVGADYTSDFDTVLVGANIAVGLDLGEGSISDIDSVDTASGFGFSGSLLLGTRLDTWIDADKLWFLETDRTKVFANLFFFDVPTPSEIDASISSLGFRVQYKWVKPKQAAYGVFKWNGVDITTGLQYSKMDIELRQSLVETVEEGAFTGSANLTATLGLKTTNFIIPVEITTGGRLLYLLNVYAGLGADIAFGSSETVGAIAGPIALSGGAGTNTGDASLDLGKKDGPDIISPRAMLGLQIDLPIVKIALLNVNIHPSRVSVTSGIRIVW